MHTHQLQQGSNEWLQARAKHLTASEAPAMLNVSTYMNRTQLLDLKKTGIAEEVDPATQKRFDDGHKFEEMARPFAEEIIGEELFPVTGSIELDGLHLMASFDGLTMLEDIGWEHKMINEKLRESLSANVIPEQYHPQLEQQLIVSSAEKILFMASDGTKENMLYAWYESNPELRQNLLAGWNQFQKDLAEHEPAKVEIKSEVKQIEQLPSLFVQLKGEVTDSNLEIYKSTALEFINSINTELSTDNDFAEAENVVKFCKKAESELSATKQAALAQTASIDELFKTVDFLSEELRQKRLYLDKLVKSKKTELKQSIVKKAEQKLGDHIRALEEEISPMKIPAILIGFNETIRGKKTISSIQNAVDSELANIKINADEIASLIRKNLSYLESAADAYKFLFNDLQAIITKQQDDFQALIDLRVSNHKAEEQKRLEAERERIRQEEEAKAKAEQEHLRSEEERKRLEEDRRQAEDHAKKQEKVESELKAIEANSRQDRIDNIRNNLVVPDAFLSENETTHTHDYDKLELEAVKWIEGFYVNTIVATRIVEAIVSENNAPLKLNF